MMTSTCNGINNSVSSLSCNSISSSSQLLKDMENFSLGLRMDLYCVANEFKEFEDQM